MDANELTRKIIGHLYKMDVFAWRQNSAGVFDARRKIWRSGAKKGVSDILGITRAGKLIAIEIKASSDRLSIEQQGFLDTVKQFNGIALCVVSYADFLEKWELSNPS